MRTIKMLALDMENNHTSYELTQGRLPDFIVEYHWCPMDELKMVRRCQGIRTDFLYEGDDPKIEGIHMIWPEFLDEKGHIIIDKENEVSESGYANMWVFWDERRQYHKERLKVGTKGFMVFGSGKVAKVSVIQIGSLNEV